MKVTIPTTQEVDITHVYIVVAVRYEEEDIPNDFPFRKGDVWSPTIELSTGKIVDWPSGVSADFSMKICDQGSYFLLDEKGKTILSIENNYVPNSLIPGEFGDYIKMTIDENGVITNWPKRPSIHEFINED